MKVFGFDDVERHALNTMFRLSENRPVTYALWSPESRAKAHVALLDGDSWEASLELANPLNDALQLIWVGTRAPGNARLIFARPLQWAAVIAGMDRLFSPVPLPPVLPVPGLPAEVVENTFADTEFIEDQHLVDSELTPDASVPGSAATDMAHHLQATAPALLSAGDITAPAPFDAAPAEDMRALVINPSRDTRVFLTERLSETGVALVDEAVTGAQALELLGLHHYWLAIIDMGVTDMGGWALLKKVEDATPAIEHLIITAETLSPVDQLRGRFSRAHVCLKPLNNDGLQGMLSRLIGQQPDTVFTPF